jgi:hypothetical protein
VDPKEIYLGGAHSAMRHAQPQHNAGSEARHTPKSFQTLGPKGTPRRHTPLRHEEPDRPAPPGPLTAPLPPTQVQTRPPRLQPAQTATTATSSAVSPLTGGRLVPGTTRGVPREGQPHPAPTNHRQAIHHQATSAELQSRNRERG